MPRSPISLLGNRYGKLVVTSLVSRNKFGNSRWLCQCDCGGSVEVMYQNLELHKPGRSLQFLKGYLEARRNTIPRLAYRIVRSDLKVVDGCEKRD